MEGQVALHLLHDLVDVPVEHGGRAEALQVTERAGTVFRTPSPLRIDGPERNMREDDDRLRRRTALEVVFKPFELLIAEIAKPARFQFDDVHEPDEVHAIVVEAVPAGAFRAASVAVEIKLALVLIEQIVLARHVTYVQPRV